MGREVLLIFRDSQLLGEANLKVLILLPHVAYCGKVSVRRETGGWKSDRIVVVAD